MREDVKLQKIIEKDEERCCLLLNTWDYENHMLSAVMQIQEVNRYHHEMSCECEFKWVKK